MSASDFYWIGVLVLWLTLMLYTYKDRADIEDVDKLAYSTFISVGSLLSWLGLVVLITYFIVAKMEVKK